MLSLFAESQQVEPAFLGQWVLAAGVVLSVLLQLRQYQDRNKTQQREITGKTLEVKKATEPASSTDLSRVDADVKDIESRVREDVGTLHKKIDELHNHINGSERRLSAAGEERITRLQATIAQMETALHNRVTDVANRIAHLEGVVEVIRAKK